MAERIVINTGPIIALTRSEATGLLPQLRIEFVCPEQVRAEIEAGAARGYSVTWPECVKVVGLAVPVDPIAVATLDAGEAAMIQLALEQGVEWVCVDDEQHTGDDEASARPRQSAQCVRGRGDRHGQAAAGRVMDLTRLIRSPAVKAHFRSFLSYRFWRFCGRSIRPTWGSPE